MFCQSCGIEAPTQQITFYQNIGILVMVVYVIGVNRLIWRPLYALAERKYRMA